MSDETQIGLNNDDANQVFRICIKHKCKPDQAEAIAQEVNDAYERSAIGQAKRKLWPILITAGGTSLTAIIGGLTAYFLGFFDK